MNPRLIYTIQREILRWFRIWNRSFLFAYAFKRKITFEKNCVGEFKQDFLEFGLFEMISSVKRISRTVGTERTVGTDWSIVKSIFTSSRSLDSNLISSLLESGPKSKSPLVKFATKSVLALLWKSNLCWNNKQNWKSCSRQEPNPTI